ncbi:hypothetical protein PPBDW_I21727 [Photobacterium kishitanii]|nr:hypothetical protein PPBDW_I21727 [Photobacterium kishitanii]
MVIIPYKILFINYSLCLTLSHR